MTHVVLSRIEACSVRRERCFLFCFVFLGHIACPRSGVPKDGEVCCPSPPCTLVCRAYLIVPVLMFVSLFGIFVLFVDAVPSYVPPEKPVLAALLRACLVLLEFSFMQIAVAPNVADCDVWAYCGYHPREGEREEWTHAQRNSTFSVQHLCAVC